MNKKTKAKTRFGLPLATIEQIHGVFKEFLAVEKVVLYGSRAMGNYRRGSDIDLTLHGEDLTHRDSLRIAAALDDLPTPYMFDVSVFGSLTHAKLRDHIERKGVVFYERIGDGNPLPKRWKMVKLGDVCENLDAKRKPVTKSDRTKGQYPYYGASGIVDWVNDYIFDDDLLLISEDGANLLARATPIAFSISGKSWVNNHAHVLKFENKTTMKFIEAYINFIDVSYYVTGTAQPKLNQKSLNLIPIPLPPQDEQERIVAKLDAIFAETERHRQATEQKIANWHALKQAILTQALTKQKNWQMVKLGNLFSISSSKRVLKSEWKKEGVPFYRGREVTQLSKYGFVDNELFISEEHFEEVSSKYGVPNTDDIIITAIGTIGNSYIVQEKDKFYFKDGSVLWLQKKADINSNFVNQWFKSHNFFMQLDKGNGTTVDTLTIVKLNGIYIDVPPLEEQERIVAQLDTAFDEINHALHATEQQQHELANLKNSVLNEAFKGNLLEAV